MRRDEGTADTTGYPASCELTLAGWYLKHFSMLCQICQAREAHLHFSQKAGTDANEIGLCEECFRTSVPTEILAALDSPPIEEPDAPENK